MIEQAESLNPRTRGPKVYRPARGAPFYAFPRVFINDMIGPLADSLRSLPIAQLTAEIDELAAITASPGDHFAEGLLLAAYRAEKKRRADPELVFDIDLDAALTRIGSKTNDQDRALITDAGHKLFAIGGRDALVRAWRRLLTMAPDQRSRQQRKGDLVKRWAGIAPKGGAQS